MLALGRTCKRVWRVARYAASLVSVHLRVRTSAAASTSTDAQALHLQGPGGAQTAPHWIYPRLGSLCGRGSFTCTEAVSSVSPPILSLTCCPGPDQTYV